MLGASSAASLARAWPVILLIANRQLSMQGGNERLGWSSAKCAWVSAAVAGGCTLLTIVFAMPVVKRYVFEETNLRWAPGGCS